MPVPLRARSAPALERTIWMMLLSAVSRGTGRVMADRMRHISCLCFTVDGVAGRVLIPGCALRLNGTSPGGKEGRRQAHKNIMPYRPVYLWEITVNNLFTAVTSSWDSSPQPVNGRRATVGPVTRGRDI